MNTKILTFIKSIFIISFFLWFLTNCTYKTIEGEPDTSSVASCEGCHTNYTQLKEVYSPDTTAPVSGCGGAAPHYEPYDRVYMGGDGYEAFKTSSHHNISCTGCHNGTDGTSDKNLAHSGDFLSHPSMNYDEKCGTCHQSITAGFATNLHHGTGQKRKVAMRSGLNGPDNFDDLPAHKIEGYNANCAQCHGTCGNCHVVRPPAGGGGLSKGHAFTKTPDMISVCVTCHHSRGGHAYLGVAPGTQPDVHLTSLNYTCLDCHNEDEIHGDGNPVEQRYAYSKLPKCENCHTNLEATFDSIPDHKQHLGDFNCQVCHSQDYNNCGSCHIHGEGARIPAYLGFKIAANPIPDIKPGFDLVLVRRTLAAPDNWEEYGVDDYADFEAFPTYNYTSPHNILRKTVRTTVADGQSCYENCHIRIENGDTINKELYLFEDDLLEWEKSATQGITVDDKLPSWWFN